MIVLCGIFWPEINVQLTVGIKMEFCTGIICMGWILDFGL